MSIEIPNLPNNFIKKVLIDKRADKKILNSFDNLKIEYLLVDYCDFLQKPEACHPDMLFHHLGGSDIVIAPQIYEKYYKNTFFNGFNLIKGDTLQSCNYPFNIAYNVARVGDFAFAHKNLDNKIKKYFNANNIKVINVNQGYAKCSVCIINKNAIITADKSIYKSALKNNIDALLIKEGYIRLDGFDYGFIGGATVLLDKNILAFTGRIDHHPSNVDICNFLKKYNIEIFLLSDDEIYDLGSIIPIL